MDMYQKRKMRQENKKMDENTKSLSSTNINWYIQLYGKTHSKPYKYGVLI